MPKNSTLKIVISWDENEIVQRERDRRAENCRTFGEYEVIDEKIWNDGKFWDRECEKARKAIFELSRRHIKRGQIWLKLDSNGFSNQSRSYLNNFFADFDDCEYESFKIYESEAQIVVKLFNPDDDKEITFSLEAIDRPKIRKRKIKPRKHKN